MSFSSDLAALFARCERGREDMHFYQDGLAVPFLKKNPFSALFADVGLGKSASAATVIADNFDAGNWEPWLVVGPKRVITQTWPEEFRTWRHLAHLTYGSPFDKQYKKELSDAARKAVKFERALLEIDEPAWDLPGDHLKMVAYWSVLRKVAEEARLKQAHKSIVDSTRRCRAYVHLVSRDVFEHLVDAWGVKRFPYRKIIIDESQSFKSHKAGRFKAMKRIRHKLKRMHHLTATPAAESYLDLFAPMQLLDEGERLGKFITHYRERYFQADYNGFNWKLLPDADEKIAAKISDIVLTLRAEDYLQLDKPLFINRPVRLGTEARKKYDMMAKHFVMTTEDEGEKLNVVAESAGILQNKLLQMSSGFVYDEKKKPHFIHDAKIETLKEIVEELQGEPVLVAYWYKPTLDRLRKSFPKAVVLDEKGKYKEKWDKRQTPMLLLHPQSGGAGLNLQKGSHHLIIFDMFYSNELYTQLVGRLARQGQRNIVKVMHLIAQGTHDDDVLDAINDKENGQAKLKRALRRIRQQIEDGTYQSHEEEDLETL